MRLPRRQDLERTEPEAYISVEKLKKLDRSESEKLKKLHSLDDVDFHKLAVALLANARPP